MPDEIIHDRIPGTPRAWCGYEWDIDGIVPNPERPEDVTCKECATNRIIEVTYADGTTGRLLWPTKEEIEEQEKIFRQVWGGMREATERIIQSED